MGIIATFSEEVRGGSVEDTGSRYTGPTNTPPFNADTYDISVNIGTANSFTLTGTFTAFGGSQDGLSINSNLDTSNVVPALPPSGATLTDNGDGSFTAFYDFTILNLPNDGSTIMDAIIVDDSAASAGGDTDDTVFLFITRCFLQGTHIATPEGEVAVEALQIGDLVCTQDGRAVPVRWVGQQTVSTVFGPADRLRPVRICAGALGHGLPHRDLNVTSDHAMLLDGVLIDAGALVNGDTIYYVPMDEFQGRYRVYHVETDQHEVLLAEGAPSESFVDYATRRGFDNYAGYLARYGVDRVIDDMPCPRISTARLVPSALRQRLSSKEAG